MYSVLLFVYSAFTIHYQSTVQQVTFNICAILLTSSIQTLLNDSKSRFIEISQHKRQLNRFLNNSEFMLKTSHYDQNHFRENQINLNCLNESESIQISECILNLLKVFNEFHSLKQFYIDQHEPLLLLM